MLNSIPDKPNLRIGKSAHVARALIHNSDILKAIEKSEECKQRKRSKKN